MKGLEFMSNILDEFNLSEIIENMGLALIYKKRYGFVNKLKGVCDYYEVICTDMGFKLDNDIFVSLNNDVGKTFSIGLDEADNIFAINFKTFDELSSEFKGYKPQAFLKEYEESVGDFYLYNAAQKEFKQIVDGKFLVRQKRNKKDDEKGLNILEMYDKVKKVVIAQDEPLRQILASIYKNQKIINSSLDDETISKLKENIIVYGPTGTGKTEILTQIAKLYDIPIVIEDVTSFTETGYIGRDVSDMLTDLYYKAGMDLERAQKGILILDEFDKLAEGGTHGKIGGPSPTGVQRSLLKVLDGGTLSIREDYYDSAMIDFNTSKLTVVALGAFSGIKHNDDYSDVAMTDFIEYGIMREVMGRFSKLVSMNAFSKDDIISILLKSDLSPLNTYKKLFEAMGTKFTYDDELVDYIADEAMALNCGARSLKTVFDGIISDDLFDIFASKVKSVHLSVPTDKGKSFVAKKNAREKKKVIGFC